MDDAREPIEIPTMMTMEIPPPKEEDAAAIIVWHPLAGSDGARRICYFNQYKGYVESDNDEGEEGEYLDTHMLELMLTAPFLPDDPSGELAFPPPLSDDEDEDYPNNNNENKKEDDGKEGHHQPLHSSPYVGVRLIVMEMEGGGPNPEERSVKIRTHAQWKAFKYAVIQVIQEKYTYEYPPPPASSSEEGANATA